MAASSRASSPTPGGCHAQWVHARPCQHAKPGSCSGVTGMDAARHRILSCKRGRRCRCSSCRPALCAAVRMLPCTRDGPGPSGSTPGFPRRRSRTPFFGCAREAGVWRQAPPVGVVAAGGPVCVIGQKQLPGRTRLAAPECGQQSVRRPAHWATPVQKGLAAGQQGVSVAFDLPTHRG